MFRPGEMPLIGTCEGSSLIESKTGRDERIRVLSIRAMKQWSPLGHRPQA